MSFNVIDANTNSNEFASSSSEIESEVTKLLEMVESEKPTGNIRISKYSNVRTEEKCRVVNHDDLTEADFIAGEGFYEVERVTITGYTSILTSDWIVKLMRTLSRKYLKHWIL